MDIELPVELVPQPSKVSCWAAAMAMVVSYRDRASYTAESIAETAGMDTNTGYGWPAILNAVAVWNLRQLGPASAMPERWAKLLDTYGPLWIVETGNPYHAVVVAGIHGDGTLEQTTVTVYNPWPPNQGAVETIGFLDFDSDFGLGAGADAQIVCG